MAVVVAIVLDKVRGIVHLTVGEEILGSVGVYLTDCTVN